MPWLSSAVAGAGGASLLYHAVCYAGPKAELYNDGTLVKSLSPTECTLGTITNGGHVTVKFSDSSTDAYIFNRIVLKRSSYYYTPSGRGKTEILTINVPEGKAKTANMTLSFSIRLTIATTSG